VEIRAKCTGIFLGLLLEHNAANARQRVNLEGKRRGAGTF